MKIELYVQQDSNATTIYLPTVPRVGERITAHNYHREKIIDGIVSSVEYTYRTEHDISITIRVG